MNNSNRNTLAPALVLIAIGALALFGEGNGLAILAILFGLLMLVRQFDNNNLTVSWGEDYDEGYEYGEEEDEEYEERRLAPSRQAHSEPIYRHALEAVSRAGLDPDSVQVLPVDIGFLAFKGADAPVFYRMNSLPDDLDYIQPVVQLRLPTQAMGRVRFEIFDGAGQPVFIHEDNHKLERGRNLVSPAARLPIHDQREMEGNWEMHVSADGVLLARHRFGFTEANNAAVRQHLGEDGELTTELRAALTESSLPKMSLDDLLSYQDDEEAQQGQV